MQVCRGFPSTGLTAHKCNNSSQYSCQRAAFVFVLGQGNKLIGSPPSERGRGWVVRAPRRNLKPCKSAIVSATRGAQGDPPPHSPSRRSDLGVEGIVAEIKGGLLFPPIKMEVDL